MKTLPLKLGIAKQQGSIILESLIAILIFSIGILGLVGLQAAAINNVADAKYRTEASLLANQIIGQMWLDDKTTAALQNNYSGGMNGGITGGKYAAWKANVQRTLPGVADFPPSIVIDANNQATISIRWKSPSESTPHTHATIARING